MLGLIAMAFSLVLAPIASADQIFSDSFGSGTFSAWNGGEAQTGGDGTATVQSVTVNTPQCPAAPATCYAAEFTESANPLSKAYARETFGAGAQMDLTVSGAFDVTQQGASGNVPLFRLLNPTSARVVSVYRQDGTSGTIGVGYGGGNFNTTGKLALGTWATVSVNVVVGGAASTITVTLNGKTVYQATANLGSAGIETMQIGNDTAAQAGQVYVDNISAQGTSPTPSPPVNTAPPTISGTAQQGQTLTASQGSWTSTTPISYTYQWQRCDASGANCSAISGATGNSYGVTSADVGSTLAVTVVASNVAGSAPSVSSAPTAVVSAPSSPPANTAPPTISGKVQVGQLLTASAGGWTGAAPMTDAFQWERCDASLPPSPTNCTAIAGATQPQYTVVNQDLDSTLAVQVNASNSAGSASAFSAATAVVGASSAAMVALWPMDQAWTTISGTTGTMVDEGGSDNGTFNNNNVKLEPPSSGTAYGFGTAYGLKSPSYVSVPTADHLNPYNANVTVTIDFETTGTPPVAPDDWDLIRKGDYKKGVAWNEYKVELQNDGQISCGFDGTNPSAISKSNPWGQEYMELQAGPKDLNNGQWHTAECIKTATAIKEVIDGQVFSQAVTVKGGLGSISNTLNVIIGDHSGSLGGDQYSGALDAASLQFGP